MYVFLVITVFLAYCTKKDQVVSSSSGSSSTLNAYKTSTAPVIDGNVDAIWANAQALSVTPTVPDPGNGLFMGYCGEQYPATIQSMYDANNVYFLVKWNDSTSITPVQPWVFDPVRILGLNVPIQELLM